MSVIIPNMKMPKYTMKAEFGIDADGNPLCMVYHEDGTDPDIYDVVPLPEGHGDLMDKAAFETDIKNRYCTGCDNYKGLKCKACWVDDMLGEVEDAPTIVPAEGGNKE